MQITIKQFQEIYTAVKSTEDEIDRLVNVCAILHGGKPEDYLNKTPAQLSKYKVDISVPEGKAPVTFKVKGQTYVVNHLVSSLTMAEFIDLTTFTQTEESIVENIHNIIAVFAKPEKKWFKKRETDREKIADHLLNHLSIEVAYPTAVFFSSLYKSLLNRTRSYLMKQELPLLKKQHEAMQDLLKDIGAGS